MGVFGPEVVGCPYALIEAKVLPPLGRVNGMDTVDASTLRENRRRSTFGRPGISEPQMQQMDRPVDCY
jgi:hypothetical protein